jgi:hypothetical protein
MTFFAHSSRLNRRRIISATVSAVILAALALPSVTIATPASPATTTPDAGITQPLSASLETTMPAVPVGGALDYTAQIRCSGAPSYLQARLSVSRPGGKLVYRKTLLAPAGSGNIVALRFQRDLADLALSPGAHRVELEVRAEINGQLATQTLTSSLLVYGPDIRRIPVAIVARICAVPMTDAAGTRVADPSIAQKARLDADAIAHFALSDPAARISMAIPPMLLQDWALIAKGYKMPTAGGTIEVPAEDAVPRAYAATLGAIAEAVSSGRLELLSQGFSDPDLALMSSANLTEDIGVQYDFGRAVATASVAASTSAGTSLANGWLDEKAIVPLERAGIRFAVFDQNAVESGLSTTPAGAYRLRGHDLVAIVTDPAASADLQTGDESALIRRSYDRALSNSAAPFIAQVELDQDSISAGQLLDALQVEFAQPWVQPVTATRASAFVGSRRVRPTTGPIRKSARDFWADIARVSAPVRALVAAADIADPDASRALSSLFTAESSCWSSGPKEPSSDRAEGFAEDAENVAQGVLGKIGVRGAAVTLAGAKGKVPVTVTNRTGRTLRVGVRAVPGSGLRVVGRRTRPTTLLPQDNYLQIPVDLGSALSGKLRIDVVSAGVVIASSDVQVKASYLDRLAVIGIIAVLLGIGLALIVRRVQAADRSVGAGDEREGYTESENVPDSRGDS